MTNPAIDDRDVELILSLVDLDGLLQLPQFADHDRQTCLQIIAACRNLARAELLPAYRALDAEPPRFVDGRVVVHPTMHRLFARLVELDVIAAPRPVEVGGAGLPLTVFTLATVYLMAGNLSAYAYLGLTQGAAHLLEVFGSDALRETYMRRMYRGEWTGTMALTEPQAGSSLAEVATAATPSGDHYLLRGAKIFISGGDHDLVPNIVHMVLARIDGAPPGIKGVSLFCVPQRRVEGDHLVDNDVAVTGVIHKIGWRALPSVALAFGESGDCRGWLVGEPHQGIRYMFQMMNEARLMVGLNGVATASVAYHESLAYARVRVQPKVPIAQHADVKRMLLRQHAIVVGGLALIAVVSSYADRGMHALVDLLTPVCKSFPAERGFEANALALQIHGGYGYSSEFPVEAWLRDQKLNSIHEGTTGIQALDLATRRIANLPAFAPEIERVIAKARAAGLDVAAFERAAALVSTTVPTAAHATDFLDLFGTFVIAWIWLDLAATADPATDFGRVKRLACEYWHHTELPRLAQLAALSADESYLKLDPSWL